MTDIFDRLWDRVFNNSWYDNGYVSNDNPIIIGGCARSGTTLMRVILDSHSHIYCGPESYLFVSNRILTKNAREKLASRFEVSIKDIDSFVASSSSLPKFIETFFRHIANTQGKKRWGEKTPTNVRRLGYIFKQFPNARFIHMLRDGRDNVCSLRRHPSRKIVNGKVIPLNTNNPIRNCIERWVEDVSFGRKFLGDSRYLEIKYEDLVEDQRSTLETVLKFLEEPWDESLLNYYEIKGSSRNFEKFPQNIEATRPIYNKAIGRWKSDLSEDEKKLFKEIAGELLINLGYVEDNEW
jgi:hypothetical protein